MKPETSSLVPDEPVIVVGSAPEAVKAQLNGRTPTPEEEFALREKILEDLGHECDQCTVDAHVAAFVEGLGKYSLLSEVEQWLEEAKEREIQRTHEQGRVGHARLMSLKEDEAVARLGLYVEEPDLPAISTESPGLDELREVRRDLTVHARILGMTKVYEELLAVDAELPVPTIERASSAEALDAPMSRIGVAEQVEVELEAFDFATAATVAELPRGSRSTNVELDLGTELLTDVDLYRVADVESPAIPSPSTPEQRHDDLAHAAAGVEADIAAFDLFASTRADSGAEPIEVEGADAARVSDHVTSEPGFEVNLDRPAPVIEAGVGGGSARSDDHFGLASENNDFDSGIERNFEMAPDAGELEQPVSTELVVDTSNAPADFAAEAKVAPNQRVEPTPTRLAPAPRVELPTALLTEYAVRLEAPILKTIRASAAPEIGKPIPLVSSVAERVSDLKVLVGEGDLSVARKAIEERQASAMRTVQAFAAGVQDARLVELEVTEEERRRLGAQLSPLVKIGNRSNQPASPFRTSVGRSRNSEVWVVADTAAKTVKGQKVELTDKAAAQKTPLRGCGNCGGGCQFCLKTKPGPEAELGTEAASHDSSGFIDPAVTLELGAIHGLRGAALDSAVSGDFSS